MPKLDFVLEQKGNTVLKASFPLKDRALLLRELLRKGFLSRLRVFEYAVLMKLFSSKSASLTKDGEVAFGMVIILLLSFSRKRRLEWNSFLRKAISVLREMAGGDVASEILALVNTSWGREHFLGEEYRSHMVEGVLFIEEVKEAKVRPQKRPRTPSSVGTKSHRRLGRKDPEGMNEEPSTFRERKSWEENLNMATHLVGILIKGNANPYEGDIPFSKEASEDEKREFLETLKRKVFNHEA